MLKKKFFRVVSSTLAALSIMSLSAGAVSSQISGSWTSQGCTITITSTCNESVSSTGVFAGGVIASSKTMDKNVLGGYADLYNSSGSIVLSSDIAINGSSAAKSINFVTRAYNKSGTYYGIANAMCYTPQDTYYRAGKKTPNLVYNATKSILNWDVANEQIAVNESGETYGIMAASIKQNIALDLISAIGDNNIKGYIKAEDRLPQFASYNDVLEYESHDHKIPLYAADGVTVLDTYTIYAPTIVSCE